ncbi:MAG TPA: hypothetical protein PLE45_09125 [Spirochaetota bacterium]|nr:hypothetical protein [Spirochaetota bacterium]HOL57224.1 hypothetical protein [Spirochaetota bacterium]HPP04859.1 hypothetical protein [Spirochaetota bacterium]
MTIQDEVKDLFNMILQHPDEIYKLNLFIKLKNGTLFSYKIDKKLEDNLLLKERIRKQKIEEKHKKLEEKIRKKEEKEREKSKKE